MSLSACVKCFRVEVCVDVFNIKSQEVNYLYCLILCLEYCLYVLNGYVCCVGYQQGTSKGMNVHDRYDIVNKLRCVCLAYHHVKSLEGIVCAEYKDLCVGIDRADGHKGCRVVIYVVCECVCIALYNVCCYVCGIEVYCVVDLYRLAAKLYLNVDRILYVLGDSVCYKVCLCICEELFCLCCVYKSLKCCPIHLVCCYLRVRCYYTVLYKVLKYRTVHVYDETHDLIGYEVCEVLASEVYGNEVCLHDAEVILVAECLCIEICEECVSVCVICIVGIEKRAEIGYSEICSVKNCCLYSKICSYESCIMLCVLYDLCSADRCIVGFLCYCVFTHKSFLNQCVDLCKNSCYDRLYFCDHCFKLCYKSFLSCCDRCLESVLKRLKLSLECVDRFIYALEHIDRVKIFYYSVENILSKLIYKRVDLFDKCNYVLCSLELCLDSKCIQVNLYDSNTSLTVLVCPFYHCRENCLGVFHYVVCYVLTVCVYDKAEYYGDRFRILCYEVYHVIAVLVKERDNLFGIVIEPIVQPSVCLRCKLSDRLYRKFYELVVCVPKSCYKHFICCCNDRFDAFLDVCLCVCYILLYCFDLCFYCCDRCIYLCFDLGDCRLSFCLCLSDSCVKLCLDPCDLCFDCCLCFAYCIFKLCLENSDLCFSLCLKLCYLCFESRIDLKSLFVNIVTCVFRCDKEKLCKVVYVNFESCKKSHCMLIGFLIEMIRVIDKCAELLNSSLCVSCSLTDLKQECFTSDILFIFEDPSLCIINRILCYIKISIDLRDNTCFCSLVIRIFICFVEQLNNSSYKLISEFAFEIIIVILKCFKCRISDLFICILICNSIVDLLCYVLMSFGTCMSKPCLEYQSVKLGSIIKYTLLIKDSSCIGDRNKGCVFLMSQSISKAACVAALYQYAKHCACGKLYCFAAKSYGKHHAVNRVKVAYNNNVCIGIDLMDTLNYLGVIVHVAYETVQESFCNNRSKVFCGNSHYLGECAVKHLLNTGNVSMNLGKICLGEILCPIHFIRLVASCKRLDLTFDICADVTAAKCKRDKISLFDLCLILYLLLLGSISGISHNVVEIVLVYELILAKPNKNIVCAETALVELLEVPCIIFAEQLLCKQYGSFITKYLVLTVVRIGNILIQSVSGKSGVTNRNIVAGIKLLCGCHSGDLLEAGDQLIGFISKSFLLLGSSCGIKRVVTSLELYAQGCELLALNVICNLKEYFICLGIVGSRIVHQPIPSRSKLCIRVFFCYRTVCQSLKNSVCDLIVTDCVGMSEEGVTKFITYRKNCNSANCVGNNALVQNIVGNGICRCIGQTVFVKLIVELKQCAIDKVSCNELHHYISRIIKSAQGICIYLKCLYRGCILSNSSYYIICIVQRVIVSIVNALEFSCKLCFCCGNDSLNSFKEKKSLVYRFKLCLTNINLALDISLFVRSKRRILQRCLSGCYLPFYSLFLSLQGCLVQTECFNLTLHISKQIVEHVVVRILALFKVSQILEML